jgi:hypothetical protein
MKMSRGQPSWRRLIRWTHGTFSGLHFLRQRSNVLSLPHGNTSLDRRHRGISPLGETVT